MEEGLILDGENEKALKERERILTMFGEWRENNLSAKEKRERTELENEKAMELLQLKRNFAQNFVKRCEKLFGISGGQLQELRIVELEKTEALIIERSRKWAVLQWGLMGLLFLIPVMGWITVCTMRDCSTCVSVEFFRFRKKLKKFYGENYLKEIYGYLNTSI